MTVALPCSLLQELLTFVEREKTARGAVQAQVDGIASNVASLREWAESEVVEVRREVGEGVEALIAAVHSRTAALKEARAQLERQVDAGLAALRAKRERGTLRTLFLSWR